MRKLHYYAKGLLIALQAFVYTFHYVYRQCVARFAVSTNSNRYISQAKVLAISVFTLFMTIEVNGQIICAGDPVPPGPTSCTTANGNMVTTAGNQAAIMSGPLAPFFPCSVLNPDFGGAQTATFPWVSVGVTQTPFPILPLTPGTVVETRGFFARFVPFPPFLITENCVVENVVFGIDVNDPVVFCGPGATVECSGDVGAAAISSLIINDCSATTTVVNSITPDPLPGCGFPLVATVDMTVTDDCGNSTNITCDVTVEDNTPPTISCPADQDRNFDAFCQYTMEDFTGLATLMDNCDDDLDLANVVQTPPAGTVIMGACGPTIQVVTLEYTDCNGNGPAMCTFNVNITDITPPVAQPGNCPGPVILNANDMCEVTVPDLRAANLFSDGCDPVDPNNIIQSPAPGTVLDVSALVCADNTIDVSFDYTDCNGNPATTLTCMDALDVRDITAPDMLVSCPATVPVFNLMLDPVTCTYTSVTVPADFFDGLAVVSDNCDGDPTERNNAVVFDCNNLGLQAIDIFGEDCSGNVSGVLGQCDVLIQVNPDDANWNNPGPLCTSDGVVDLNTFITGQTCGEWSGDIVTVGDMAAGGGLFDAAAAGPGAYSVTYRVGDANCHIELTRTILVEQNFDPELIDDFAVCWTPDEVLDLETLLAAGVPEGGEWTIVSQVAASGGPSTPGIVLLPAPGNDHVIRYDGGCLDATIRYTLTDCSGTVESDDITLSIQQPPVASFDVPSSLCQDEFPFSINNGVRTLEGCGDYNVTFEVISGPAGNTLIGGAPVTGPITGFPVVTVNPQVQQGRYRIRLTISDPNGVCPDAVHEEIVNIHRDAENPNGIINPGPVCENAATDLVLALQDPNDEAGIALPAADIRFFGLGVTDGPGVEGRFTAPDTDGDGLPGPGTFAVCVSLGDSRCLETYCEDIVINNDIEDPDLVADFTLCAEPDEIVPLASLLDGDDLPGGTWSIASGPTGTLTGVFDPNNAIYTGGCGSVTLQYEFVDDCNPPATPATITITFNERPDIDLVTQGPLCVLDAPTIIANNASVPVCGSFGTFTGPGITDNGDGTATFNPAVAGEGVHDVMYTISTDAGCSESGSVQVVVDAASDASFALANDLCVDDAAVTLMLTNPDPSVLGGGSVVNPTEDGNVEVTWDASCGACLTDNGDGTASFDPAVAGEGTFLITVYTGDPSCMQSRSDLVTVHEGIDATLVADVARGCFDFSASAGGGFTDFNLTELYTPGTTPGGVWTYIDGPGASVRGETMSALPGCHQLRYTVEAAFQGADGECAQMFDEVFVLLGEEAQPEFDLAQEVCWDGVAGSISLPTLYNGSTFGTSSTRSYAWVANQISGVGPVPTFSDPAAMEPMVIIQGAGLFEVCLTERLDYAPCGANGATFCSTQICHQLSVTETAVEVSAAWDPVGAQCEDDARIYLGAASGGMGMGLVTGDLDGVFSGEGVVEDPVGSGEYYFDPTAVMIAAGSTSKDVNVCYTVNSGAGCTAVECHDIRVYEGVNIDLFGGGNFNYLCQIPRGDGRQPLFDLSLMLNPGSTQGGTWTVLSGPGRAVNGFISGTAGCYELEYVVSAFGGADGACTETATTFIRLTEQPTPGFDLGEEVCWDGVPGSVTLPTIYNGNTFGNNATINYDWSINTISGGPAPIFSATDVQEPTLSVQGAGEFEICLTESMDYPACGGMAALTDYCGQTICHTLTITETSMAVDASWTGVGPFCDDDMRVYLGAASGGMGMGQVTGTLDGVFSGNGVVEDAPGSGEYYFDPSMITVPMGTDFIDVNVCYTVNSSAGCTAVECQDIRVYGEVSADVIGDVTLGCQNFNSGFGGPFIYFDLDRLLGPDAARGGTWTAVGGGVAGDVLIASPGCTELTYTVNAFPGADGSCTDSETMFLRLAENPMPDFSLAEEVCWDGVAGSISLNTLYNGTTFGTNGTRVFNWAANVVSGGPAPTFDASDIEEPIVTVQGAGTFEICLTESIDYPACGSMPAGNFCAQTVCHTLVVTETAVEVNPGWTPLGPFCVDDARVYLGAASTGMGPGQVTGDADGVFTGTGVEEDPTGSGEYYFDPGDAGAGTHTICYTVNNGSGCTAVECHNFVVGEEVQIDCQDNAVLPCATEKLGTEQTFGPFSSNLFGFPFPQIIVIETNYTLGTFSLDGLLCPGATRGGTWSLVSDPDGSPVGFFPSGAVQGNELFFTAPGCYTVNYTVESIPGVGGACSASQNFFVTIGESPVPSFDLPDEVCWSAGSPAITYDIPDDYLTSPTYRFGVTRRYSSSNPGAASVGFVSGVVTINGPGSATICMTEDINTAVCPGIDFSSCTREVCEVITVFESNETVDPTWGPTDTLCIDDPCLDLDALVTGTAGGEFTGVGVTEDPTHPNYCFDPAIAGAGTHAVTYTVNNQAGCSGTYTRNIVVMPAVSAELNDIHIECMVAPSGNVSLPAMYAAGTTPGGTFTLLSGPITGTISGNTLIYNEAGCYEIQYSVSAFDGADDACVDTQTGFVLISEQPQPSFGIQDQVCFSDGDPALTITPVVNSPSYDAASILSVNWTVRENVSGATVSINALTGQVTISDEPGPATISGTIQVCYNEEIDWAACGDIAASTVGVNGDGCAETFCLRINVEDGTAIDAGFTSDNTEPCPGDVVNLTANVSGGVFTGLNVTDNGNGQTATLQIDSCGSYAVTYTISSPNGCSNSLTLNIGTDRTAPVVTPPNDTIVECDGSGNIADMQAWLDRVSATDNCLVTSIDTVLFNRISGCSQFVGTYVYEFVATDTCGNSARAFGSFTIQDSVAPIISGGQDMLMEECTTPPAGNFPEFDFWLSDNAGATAVDGCGGRIFWSNNFDPANWMQVCGNARFVDVTFYAEDECMNVDSITRRFGIGDVTPPMFTNCPRDIITAAAPDTWCEAFVNFSPPEAVDNCSDVTLTRLDMTGLNSGDLFPVGITVLTWEARDSCDNADTCSLKIVVNDYHTPPTFECPPAPPTANNDPGMCGADVSTQLGVDLSPTNIMDNCPDNLAIIWEVEDLAGMTLGCGVNSVNGFVFPVGTSTVKYRIQDQPLLLITEIVQEGADAVEVTNFGPASLEISCLVIERFGAGAEEHIVPINTILMAGETYVANLVNDIDYDDQAAYQISLKGTIFDQIMTNNTLDGGDIWRTRICDHDTEEDWLVTVECKASLGMLNPGLPAFPSNGTKTGIQTVLPSFDMCSFDVSVVDNEAPSCTMTDTMSYDIPGPVTTTGEACVSLDINVADDLLIGGVIVRDIEIVYPDMGDLAMALVGPDGTEVELFYRPCTSVPNMNADFADFGTRPVSAAGCAESLNAEEVWIPEEALKAFYGKSSQGTWTLDLSVDGPGQVEVLNWNVEIIGLTDFDDSPVVIQVDPNTAPDMCGDTLTWNHPFLFDNCCEGTITVEYSTMDADTLPMGGVITSGSVGMEFFGLGTTTVKYTLTDDVGNTTMCSFDVIVEDPLGLCVPPCASDCQVSCISHINVSLNENCMVPVVPSMISENISDDCNFYYDIEIHDEHGNLLPSDTLDASHLGKCFTVTLTEPECGNSCWSEVCVEDKFAPEVVCRDDTMSCVEFQFMTHEPMVIEHCQGYELRQVDEIVTNYDCNEEFQKLITQKWIAIDDSGNISDTCTQEIYISRFPFGDLVAPVRDTQIYCASGYEEDANGNPSPNAAGVPRLDVDNDILDTMLSVWPQPDFFCNVLVDYRDLDLGEVNCVRKIMRTWEITEWWCQSDSTRRFQQLIEIIDTVGPDLAIGPDTIFAKAGQRSCDALVDLPVAFVNDACHEVDRVDMVYPGGFSGDQNGGQVRLPVGANAVVYRAYDECYNETTDTVIVMVRDQVAPIAVCEQNTVITLDNDGLVHIYADVFDDGSFDECALDKIEVRRMTDNCNSGTDEWGDYVEFCCADVGQVVMVGFRVTDKSGNVNTCMVNARVQDKQAPRVTDLPDITIDCRFDWDPNNLDVFGTFVFDPADRDSIIVDADTVAFDGDPLDGLVIDNCPPVMEERLDTSGLTNCGMGFIVREFTFEDGQGNVSTSSQRIDIIPFNLFTEAQIIWPQDVDTVNVCGAMNLRPELLPVAQAFPRFIDEDECSLIGYDYEDELTDASNGSEACYSIVRTWTVIDWCQTENGQHVMWTWDQYIKVSNTVDPVITSACTDTLIEVINNDCEPFPIELTAEATDDCTDADELFWRYKIDQDNDGTFETVERGNVFNGTYPFGVHRIKWLVEDLCGNQDSCEYIFEIRNSKNPTAYCKTGVVAELTPMDLDNDGTPDTEMVEIWANDFDEGSFHICGHPVVLSFDQFDTTSSGQVLVLDCNDLPAGVKITNIPVTVWVTDRVTGNQSSCNTMVSLQDNNNVDVCNNLTGGVSGLVSTEWDVAIDEAEVMLHGSGMGMYMTDTEGEYDFQGVPLGGQYEIQPGKDGDDMNGVSTGDLVRIQRHLLGLNTLQSPYQLIAADVNNSEHVSAADIAELRKLILGVYDEFPNNNSWRFVDRGYQFPDPTDPWYEVFPETYELHPFEMDMEVDFVGVKIGDLNGDVDFGAISNQGRSTRRILLEEGQLEPGRMYEVTFRMEDMDEVDGYQFTMEWNTEVLELAEVVPNLGLDMGLHNFGMTRLDEGIITTSWVKTQDVDDDRLFVVRFTAKQQGLMSEVINVTSKVTAKEAYTADGMYTEDLTLEFRGGIQSSYFALYQNEPNPWNSTTTISFHLPKADMVQLTIFDETGRVVKMIEEAHEEGYSEVQFNADDFNGSGVLYYRLETAGHTATRKMVLID